MSVEELNRELFLCRMALLVGAIIIFGLALTLVLIASTLVSTAAYGQMFDEPVLDSAPVFNYGLMYPDPPQFEPPSLGLPYLDETHDFDINGLNYTYPGQGNFPDMTILPSGEGIYTYPGNPSITVLPDGQLLYTYPGRR